MPDEEVLVRLRGIRKSFDGATAVIDGLDLDIRRGEFLTLLGPSGSGKTTILMMLAGFEAPDAGSIEIDGRAVAGLPPHRREIGVVFQSYALFPHMTVADNVAFPLSVRRRPKLEIAERVHRALAIVRLERLADRRPHQLSGGQQQRVALARALVFRPKLVLMDEPLGALDRQLREEMQIEIKHIHERLGVTLVYVTHDQDEALTMSDRIAVLNHGQIVQLDAPAGIYEAPANAFVAGFIGDNNRLLGRVQSVDRGQCRVALADRSIITAVPGCALNTGDAVSLNVRPERIRLGPGDDGCVNRFPARVEEVIYQGDHVRVRLAVFGRNDFIVKAGHHAEALRAGDTIEIGFRPDDVRALDQG